MPLASAPFLRARTLSLLMRRWKQRREFGPVLLIYTEEPIWQQSQRPYHISILHSAVCANNKTAMQHVERLKHDPCFINPVIMESNGEIIWTTSELLRESSADTGRARRRGDRIIITGAPSFILLQCMSRELALDCRAGMSAFTGSLGG